MNKILLTVGGKELGILQHVEPVLIGGDHPSLLFLGTREERGHPVLLEQPSAN